MMVFSRRRTPPALIPLLLVLFVLVVPRADVGAQDYEAYRKAKADLENAAAEIRMAQAAVAQTLSEAMAAKFGETQKWQAIEAKLAALGNAVERQVSAMSGNMATVLAYSPSDDPPSVRPNRIFEGHLAMAREKKKELSALANAERGKIQTLDAMLAKVDKALLNASGGLLGATLEGFLPNEEQLAGEFGVVVLGAYFGPVGIVAAGTAAAAAQAAMGAVQAYYNLKAAADQAKVLSEAKQGLLQNKRLREQNLQTLMGGVRELNQIEGLLEGFDKKLEEQAAKIDRMVDGWNQQSKSAFQRRQQQLQEEARRLAAQPKPLLNVGGWAHGMQPIPPLQPGDYAGEVDGMLSRLDSYARAVEEGGDPDVFGSMATEWSAQLYERYGKAKQVYDQKYEAYTQASEVCMQQTQAAWARYQAAMAALWNSYKDKRWDDAASAAARSIQSAYDAAYNAAWSALAPYGAALRDPYREMTRLSQIQWLVEGAFPAYAARCQNAIESQTREFYRRWSMWSTTLGDAGRKVSAALAGLPVSPDEYTKRVAGLDAEIQKALTEGADVAALREGLKGTAEQLRETGTAVTKAKGDYEAARNAALLTANKARADLTSLLNRYGRVIGYGWANWHIGWSWGPPRFTPRAPDQERNIRVTSERMEAEFAFHEDPKVKEVFAADWSAMAAAFDAKAEELTFYTDWIERYRNRLGTAANRLQKISMELTGEGLYAKRDGAPGQVFAKEMGQAPWAAMAQTLETLAPVAERANVPTLRFVPWEGMTLRQKILLAQAMILQKLNADAPYYGRSVAQGAFQPVREDVMKPLEERWTLLRKLSEEYDAAAKPLQNRLTGVPEQIDAEVGAVTAEWNKVPGPSKRALGRIHETFVGAARWLAGYAGLKAEGALPVLEASSDTVSQLDTLILGYAPALERYRRQQEEAEERRRAEERRQEEEKKRQEEEGKRKAAGELASVEELYRGFKSAYESRNDALVMSYLANGWQALDGTNISGLQANLRRTFRVFDEIRYNIQNLKIDRTGEGLYTARYDLTITSRIYKRNLKHEEKASIAEEIVVDGTGKARIVRTLEGRFWLP